MCFDGTRSSGKGAFASFPDVGVAGGEHKLESG